MEPKSLGQIIRDTFAIYRKGFLPLTGIVALAQVPILLVDSLLRTPESSIDHFDALTIVIIVQYLVIAALTVLSIILMYAATIHAVSRHLNGSEISILRSYEVAWQRNKQLASSGGLLAAALFGMAITVIGIPIAVYFGIRWTFALPAVMLESARPKESLSRSSYLVRDRWWRTFIILGLVTLIWAFAGSLASGLIGLLFGVILSLVVDSQEVIAQVVGFAGGLAWMVFTPLILICLTLLYWDLRARKESIDREAISEILEFIPTEELGELVQEPAEPTEEGAIERPGSRLSSRKRKQLIELQLRHSFSSRRSWVVIAIVLGVLIGGYYGVLAMRYWQASEKAEALNADIVRISRTLREPFTPPEVLEAQLAPRLDELEELQEKFSYPTSDALVGILSETARETSVDLSSISVGNLQPESEDIAAYQGQPMTLSLRGGTPEIYQFIQSLHDKVIVTSVSNLRIGNVSGDEPSAQVSVLFFLDPEQVKSTDSEGGSQ